MDDPHVDPSSRNQSPIDAVVTWVDGNDPDHRLKRRRASGYQEEADQQGMLRTGSSETRFQDNGELYYCLKSIRAFAPWIRRVYLVTDNQRPDFLDAHDELPEDIRVVDHTTIFRGYEEALPTFNSRTIETALWRIPGLASRFIYLNDDFVLVAPTQPSTFFADDGVVLRGTWKRLSRFGPVRMWVNRIATTIVKQTLGITRSMNHLLQMRSAQLAGFEKRYFDVPHVPHPIRTATLRSFFDDNEELFASNIRHQFRSTEQFSAIYLAHHLEIARNRAVLEGTDGVTMINGEMSLSFLLERKLRQIRKGRYAFTCLQGFEKFSPEVQAKIEATLNARMDVH
ncbi:MAG: stealth family protein [Longimonas sp.]|uniref:stealth family protein n=1 Tax=Longimonas sp. TaxID=2039626 RepID=UPI003353FBAF